MVCHRARRAFERAESTDSTLSNTVSPLGAPCVGGYELFNGCAYLFAPDESDPTLHERYNTEVKKTHMC